MASKYHDTPFGVAVHPHLNKPDSKFNPDNPIFKTGLRLEGEAAQKYKDRIDEAVEAAFEDYFTNGDGKGLTPGERKKFERYYPYEIEEDAEGNPTGAIVFEYKQNAVIKMKDGSKKTVVIGLYDAKGKEMEGVIVRAGSTIRVNASMRPIPMKSLKKVGVRLDFGRVQVKELSKGNSGGFGAVEGGYEYDEDDRSSGGFGDSSEGSSDY